MTPATALSRSPFGDEYPIEITNDGEALQAFAEQWRAAGAEIVAVQGLGFVGAGMVAALADARRPDGTPAFGVIGVDLGDERNFWKVARTKAGLPPIVCEDPAIDAAYGRARTTGNLTATTAAEAYGLADVVVIDVNLDIHKTSPDPRDYAFTFDGYRQAIQAVAQHAREDALVIVETTVPPGTTEQVIRPIFTEAFAARGLNPSRLALVHSYERVMPGAKYLESITSFYRVFASSDAPSGVRARRFFDTFINTRDFPLRELGSTTASELSKVLENSFRATNIAFMQEWTQFAEAAGVDLFSVIEAIRVRPTHRNIMVPGFGVGGYCLPKDPLLADWALQSFFGGERRLDMSLDAVRTNDAMPLHTARLAESLAGGLAGRRVALLGVSYLDGVADTRWSPSGAFVEYCEAAGATVALHDPLLAWWPELERSVETTFDGLAVHACDVVVIGVRHPEYLALTAEAILRWCPKLTVLVDANNVIGDDTAAALVARGVNVAGVGKGHWRTHSWRAR